MAEGASKSSAAPQAAAPARQAQRGPSPAIGPSIGGSAQALLGLQSMAGNRAVSELLGSGRPLETNLRADMEARFGADFGAVRVHDDRLAHRSAALLEANAYTRGEHIVFGADRYSAEGKQGKHLLAHELAHVVQQRRGGAAPALDADSAHEQAAAQAADAFLRGDAEVVVHGATGVGIARDEDNSFMGRMKRKAEALKESIPPEYREKMQKAADFAADETVNAVFAPVGGSLVADGLGSTLLHAAQGQPDSGEKLKGFGRDKMLESVGAVKGVVVQVTEVADNALWLGNEYGELRNKAAEALGGKPGSTGNQIVRGAIDSVVTVVPGTGALPALSQASDGAKAAGLVDKSGNASLTDPLSEKMNDAGHWIEDQVGGAPTDSMFFTPMEKGELEGAVGSQAVLALTGAEEVKVALAVAGLMGSLRGVVESIRANHSGFYKDPAFWSAIINGAMTIVGLSKLGAGKRIVQIALKTGAMAACVPPLYKLYDDYNDPKLAAGDEADRHKVLASDWNQVINAAAGALLAIAHAGAKGKPPPEGNGFAGVSESDTGTGAKKSTGGTTLDDGGGPRPGASGEATDAQAQKPKQPSAKQQKAANKAANTAEKTATTKREAADQSQKKADKAVADAKKVLANAEAKRQTAEAKADAHEQKIAKADAKKNASPAQQDRAARGIANAKDASDSAQRTANKAEKKVPDADKAAQRAQKRAATAKAAADAAASKAQKARAKADAMKPAYVELFDPSDPEAASAPDAVLPTNKEPVVWVRTGDTDVRGTFVPETDTRRFGRGDGFAIPQPQAEEMGFTPPVKAGAAKPPPTPITPREIGGRQVESRGAGGKKGSRFISATAQTPDSVNNTSIRPDLAEVRAYNQHLNDGEVGILRPLGSNLKGVDSITARIEYDGNGRPVRAKIFLNDATTPQEHKPSKPAHAQWGETLKDAVELKKPGGEAPQPEAGDKKAAQPTPPMDFGDTELEAVIRKAVGDGEVYVRIVRVDYSPGGQGAISINPGETWRLEPQRPLVLAHPMKADDKKDKDDDDDDGDAP